MELYQALLDRLRTQHEALGSIIAGVDGEALHKQPAPGKWSIHQHIAHLATTQPTFASKIKAITEIDEPHFLPYKADEDPVFHAACERSTTSLLDDIQRDRRAMYEFVTSLSSTELARVGVHGRYGKLQLRDWVEFFLLHEAHHILSVFALAHSIT